MRAKASRLKYIKAEYKDVLEGKKILVETMCPAEVSHFAKRKYEAGKLPKETFEALFKEEKKGRTIIIGDMHGCCEAFISLLKKCRLNRKFDTLILLGDAFDRGPHSWELFMQLQKLEKEMGNRFIYLLGNHDQMLLDANTSSEEARRWRINGGLDTQKSFAAHNADLDSVRDWLKEKPYWYETEYYICVHAEFDPLQPDNRNTLLWERSIYKGTKIYDRKLVIAGHTPLRDVIYIDTEGYEHILKEKEEETLLPEKGHMIIDTGYVFGVRMTAMILRENRYRLVSFQ
ncbi:MAG: metallophosphoesterase [Eubacteriales bacterium]|nr:metallophosphoesterase [Eubacteriales bacterium]